MRPGEYTGLNYTFVLCAFEVQQKLFVINIIIKCCSSFCVMSGFVV